MKKNKSLGCFTATGLIAMLVTVVLTIAAFMRSGGSMFSPGELLAKTGQPLGGVVSHAALGGNCRACHSAPWEKTSMAERCLACHQDVAAQLQQPQSLHALLEVKAAAPSCRPCHSEHKGANATITAMPAGGFPHDSLGYALTAHAKLSSGQPFVCQDCHPQGLATFDAAICSTCHQSIDAAFMQKHNAAYGSACLNCHDGKESYGKAFDHAMAAFTLAGKHARLDCGACHTGARSIADLKATKSTCYDCHQKDDAHQGDFGQDCAACHNPSDWKQATFDHTKSAFPLIGAHLKVDCTQCHAKHVFKGTPTACSACHADPLYHQGLFGLDCAACHTTTAWQPASFSQEHTFPLNHGGANGSCQACHATSLAEYTCYSCHTDIKGDRRHAGIANLDSCVVCHANGRGGD